MLNRLEMLRLVCAAADASSFKEAAAKLGTSPQAITRAVKDLEDDLGELLFHRNTRGVQITEFGARFTAQAREMVGQMDRLFEPAHAAEGAELAGTVRITAPRSVARFYLTQPLLELARAHPRIKLELNLTEVRADAVDEKIDIGVRIGQIRDSRLVVRPVGKVAFGVAGTPELVARTRPSTLRDLSRMPVTALNDPNTGRVWPWYFAGNQQFMPSNPAFVVDDPETERDAVLSGLAYGQLSHFLYADYLANGQLVTVLDEFAPPPWDIFVYRPQRGPVPARVRLVFDHLVAALTASGVFGDAIDSR
jgi:DNA-binding transcriptional LysR family regulator